MVAIEKTACLEKLGGLFRERRTELGLFQSEIADRVGISQGHYSMIENGQRDAEFVTVVKICQILRVDLNAFISDYL
jgi:transcriptional regulator with XRE-family HTH domain